ncbi:hypothetical protein KHA80_00930 [Anaerobacillus sp. HL2]|nr:hypothetical protein KHA80_00930 [Anaerobacillus sp. HL2]
MDQFGMIKYGFTILLSGIIVAVATLVGKLIGHSIVLFLDLIFHQHLFC